jgi:membrane dipeptidase
VGIGSDFDGVSSLPVGMDDVTKYPLITEELKRRGYSNKSIKKNSWRQCAAGDESKL